MLAIASKSKYNTAKRGDTMANTSAKPSAIGAMSREQLDASLLAKEFGI